ncbi:DUF541 domain-containing protein [bacterium]|nr:MAG: DUF541 domain-containing protein [bacterium]
MEKTKQYLYIAIIIALLVGAYSVWSYVSSYGESIQPSSFRSFSVSGEGKVVAVPDVAQFDFSVVTEGEKNLGALQTENTKKMNKAIDFVKSNGVQDKDVKTQNYTISPRYQSYNCYRPLESSVQPCPPAEIVGYTVSQNVQVKVRDFSKIGDILGGVVGAGANTVSQLQFTIDDPESIKSEARAEAIEKAKTKAEEVAKAGGFSVGRLLGIDEYGQSPVYYGYGAGSGDMMAKSMESAPTPAIEPGSQDVKISVTLRYEIR